MRSGIIHNTFYFFAAIVKVLFKVCVIVLTVYFLATLTSISEEEEPRGNTRTDVLQTQQPAFYFSILPSWYDHRMTFYKKSEVKSAGISLMKQGLDYYDWMYVYQNIIQISDKPGQSSIASLMYLRDKDRLLKEVDNALQKQEIDSISRIQLSNIRSLISGKISNSILKWKPEIHFNGNQNRFHQEIKEVLSGGQKFNSLSLALKLSLILSLFSFLFSIIGGTSLALLYVNSGSFFRRILDLTFQLLYIFPVFCIAIFAVQFFTSSYYSPLLDWFPGPGSFLLLSSDNSFFELLFEQSKYLILPSIIVAVPLSAGIALRWISGMNVELEKPYIKTLESKGVDRKQIYLKHILKNASLPMILYFGLLFPALISGILLVENIFAIGGIGRLTYQSVMQDDLSMLLIITAIVAFFNIIFNKLGQYVMRSVDPRLQNKVAG